MVGIVMGMSTEQVGILISSTQIELKKQALDCFLGCYCYIVISLCLSSFYIELTFISELDLFVSQSKVNNGW